MYVRCPEAGELKQGHCYISVNLCHTDRPCLRINKAHNDVINKI